MLFQSSINAECGLPVEKEENKLDGEKIQELKNGATIVSLPLGMEYRPDKISAYYYGTPEYDWVILLVNTINGLQDLTLGKELAIPSIETIKFLGIK